MEDYRVRYEQWLNDPFIDEETKAELRSIADNEMESRNASSRNWNSVQAVCAASSATAPTD